MGAMIKFEWHRMCHSLSFWIGLLCSCALASAAAAEQFAIYLEGVDHISIFYRWIGEYKMTFSAVYFYIIIPLFTAMGYSHSGCTDRNSGYLQQLFTRCKKVHYYCAKYAVTFVGGGLIFITGVILNYLWLSLFLEAEIPDPVNLTSLINPFRFGSKLYFSNPALFAALWIGVGFLWGGLMASIGLVIGLFSDHVAVSVIGPFLLFLSQGIVAAFWMQKGVFQLRGQILELTWTEMLCAGTSCAAPTDYILSTLGALIGITALIYAIRVKRYECL